jgi:hypothetical protein
MGRDALGRDVEINFEALNIMLNEAYQLGRENENRMERGIPELDVEEEFKKVLDKLR